MVRTYSKSAKFGSVITSFKSSASKPTFSYGRGEFQTLKYDAVDSSDDFISKAAATKKSKKKVLAKPKKKLKRISNDLQFVSYESSVNCETLSPDFSFKHKSKEKETTFDKLFSGDVKRNPILTKNTGSFDSSSVEHQSCKSNSDKNGLFRSLNETEDVLEKPKPKPKKKANVSHSKQRKPQERFFSDQTLSYITKQMTSLKCSATTGDLPEKTQAHVIVGPFDLLTDAINGNQNPSECKATFEISPVRKTDPDLPYSISLGNVDSPAVVSGSLVTSTPNIPVNYLRPSIVTMKPKRKESRDMFEDVSEENMSNKNDASGSPVKDLLEPSVGIPASQFRLNESEDLFKSTEDNNVQKSDQEERQPEPEEPSNSIEKIKPSKVMFDAPANYSGRKSSFAKPGKQKYWQRKSVIVNIRRNTVGASISFSKHPFISVTRRKPSSQVCINREPIQIEENEQHKISEESSESSDDEDEEPITSLRPVTNISLMRRSHHNSSSSYIVEVNKSIEVISTLDRVLARCNQDEILPLESLYDDEIIRRSKKIGEGAFGEVFLLATDGSPVLKIVPVDGTAQVNGQPQTKLSDILAEIVISTELSQIANRIKNPDNSALNFVEVRQCFLTSGNYPESLLELWDQYNIEKVSENDRPDSSLFGSQDDPQKFVVLEFGNGGSDLEHVELKNASQGLSIFLQVAHSLAVAENLLSFEHRDLHWGNILVRESADSCLEYILDGDAYEVKTQNVQATIIDFSLSRLTSPKDGCQIFNNLAEDEDLFVATGDYQFEIYRLMREHTKNEWQQFYPKTNVFWLHYLLDKLLTEVCYKNKKSKIHTSSLASMRHYKSNILNFESCKEFVINLGDRT